MSDSQTSLKIIIISIFAFLGFVLVYAFMSTPLSNTNTNTNTNTNVNTDVEDVDIGGSKSLVVENLTISGKGELTEEPTGKISGILKGPTVVNLTPSD